jgi:anaerobic magnesium-protoporphyrin IX monomethyl ester cyclase
VLESSSAAGSSRVDVLLLEDLGQQRLPARTLAAVLQQAGLRTRLAHFGPDQDAGEVVRLAERERPCLVISSILFAHRVPEHLALITALRRAGVQAHFTMVGPLPSFAFAELLAACPALDSVLRGEAEASVVQLATSLCHSERSEESLSSKNETLRFAQGDTPHDLLGLNGLARWQAVPGLAYRSPALRANPLPKPLANLDELPFPVHDDGLPARLGCGFATVEGSRGCYHACTFCLPCASYRAAGAPHYRLRSPTHLVDEMEALYRRGTRLFLFDDEQFLPPGHTREERVAALRHELEQRRLRIAFTIKCRADDVDAALFRQLKEMGLLRVYVGLESGCQTSLDLLGKGVTVQGNAGALAVLDRLDIVADLRSLLFHPWSTLEAVRDDIGFLQSVAPSMATCFSFHEVEVYPGTPLATRLRAEGRGKGDPWPLPYNLADPRAELLRRLCRFVFSPSGAHAGIQGLLTQAWYDLLLQRRFQPNRFEQAQARKLKAIAANVNAQALLMWQEMLAFAGKGDIYDADQVNECASAWAGRIHSLCAWAEDELSEEMSPVSDR